MNYLTLDEALSFGYKFFMVDEKVYPLNAEEIKEWEGSEINLELCELETEHMVLDAYSIIESATEELCEGARENAMDSKEYKELEAICNKMTQNLMPFTTSYNGSGKYIFVA